MVCLGLGLSIVSRPIIGRGVVADVYSTAKVSAIAAAAAYSGALWFLGKPADLIGFAFTDDAGTVQAGIGDKVAFLKSRTGTFNATQTVDSQRPTIVQLANGFCVLNIDNGQHLRHTLTPPANSDSTFIASSVGVTAGYRGLIASGSGSPDYQFPAIYFDPGGTAFVNYINSAGALTKFATTSVDASLPHVLAAKKSGSTGALYVDGVVAGTGTIPSASDVMPTGVLGGIGEGGYTLNAMLGLGCAVPASMSDAHRNAVETFALLLAT